MTTAESTTPQGAGPTGAALRFARATNGFARTLAGHRLVPLWAVVHHRGRTSGRELSVPVALLSTPETFVVTLPWGPRTNWVRNVVAAGGCRVRWKGRDHEAHDPRVVGRDEARRYYPRPFWWAVEHVIGAEHFLLMRR